MSDKLIGIVGGVGSYAGIDLIKKIYDLTGATSDQDHLPVAMLSLPAQILDRTQYLLGEIDTNPGIAIADIITTLADSGAKIIGIPCNTAHAKPIYDHILAHIPESVKMIHLIEEVGKHLNEQYPEIHRVGVLGTNGTMAAQIYPEALSKFNIEVIQPPEDMQNTLVHAAIYDTYYGIKACANPVKSRAMDDLKTAGSELVRLGAEAIILGCTEIVLALAGTTIDERITINATEVLAAALIRESRGN